MSSSNPNVVSIRLEVQVPVGAGPVLTHLEPCPKLDVFFNRSVPAAGDTVPVKPSGTSGLGSICATVGYSTAQIAVKALVYPAALYPSGPNPPLPSSAVLGTPSAGDTVWSWTDSNMVPGADHSTVSPGAKNYLCVWRDQGGGNFVFDGSVFFYGLTGTSGPCGSGSGSRGSVVAMQGHLYPVFWYAEATGFTAEPLAGFNALWGLRQDTRSARPTWDNRGDGKKAVRVQLTESANRGWELSFAHGSIHIRYTAPASGGAFGPIKFAGRQETVPGVGSVALPPVLVTPS